MVSLASERFRQKQGHFLALDIVLEIISTSIGLYACVPLQIDGPSASGGNQALPAAPKSDRMGGSERTPPDRVCRSLFLLCLNENNLLRSFALNIIVFCMHG